MNTPARRRAFTLIELLVVLTIIGLLAALLFPVFARARERARQAVCESNLHQIGLAIQMYQSDNGGRLPTPLYDVSHLSMFTAEEQLRLMPLLPYERTADIQHCPDFAYQFGARGEVDVDYHSRIDELLQCGVQTNYDDGTAPCGLLKPDPMSVLVYDSQHLSTEQTYVVLRENGAVSHIPRGKIILWGCANEVWQPVATPDPLATGAGWQIFPDEPWPPQFEK